MEEKMSSDHTPPREGWQELQFWRTCYDCGDGLVYDKDDVDRARDADAEAHQREIDRLTKLAYLGDHHFPDLTYKARLEELIPKYRQLGADLATLRQERDEARTEQERLRERAKWAQFLAEWVDVHRGKHTSHEAWEAFMEQEHEKPPVFDCACARCKAALTPPAATPQEPERCVWRAEDFRAFTPPYRFCPHCGESLTVAAPQEDR